MTSGVDTYTSVPSAVVPAPATISVSSVPLGGGRTTSGAAAKFAPGASPPPHYSFSSGVDSIDTGGDDLDQGEEDYGCNNTLTEPVEETIKRDLRRIVNNVKLVVLPNPFRDDPGKALRDWDLWGPFFFVVFLGLALSWSAAIEKSEVFAVAFGVLAGGAVILTLNIVLLGGRINFFQSMSLLGYCLFPLDVGALICMFHFHILTKMWVVFVAMGWSGWAAYPYMSSAVDQKRKALALYPILLLYVSIGFFIIAID